mgnify:CR=1 FL=1
MRDTFIAKIANEIPDSGIKDFFDVANKMKDAISLGVGEPDFLVPAYVREKAIDSIQNGETKYTATEGTIHLREAVARYLSERFSLHYQASKEILITVGASEAIDLALRTLVNPGEEVLIVEPSYVSYLPCVMLCGGIPVVVPTYVKNHFKVTPQDLREDITEKTRVLILPFPNNPTGAIMEKEDLLAIREMVLAYDLFVISDEIYAELTYGTKHVSIASLPDMRERTLVLNGFSKAFAMTGWRLGFAAGPEEVISTMHKIHQYNIMSANTTSQIAGLEALTHPNRDQEIETMRRAYNERRQVLVNGFRQMGLDCYEPRGAFYVFPSIQKTGLSSMEFCERLLAEEKVAVIPGTAFGACGEGFIRCSYAYALEDIKECLKRISQFVIRLQSVNI